MPGKYQYDIELKSNVAKLLTDMKEIQDRLNTVEGKEHKIKLNVDEKKLSNVVSNLEKMLDSLGKGTGDFKQFENLSKYLKNLSGELSSIKTMNDTFIKMESSIESIRKVFADVGDGEEFSPLLKILNSVNSTLTDLKTSIGSLDDGKIRSVVQNLQLINKKVGKSQFNISVKEDNSLDAIQQQEKVNQFLEKQYNTWMKRYESILSVFNGKNIDPFASLISDSEIGKNYNYDADSLRKLYGKETISGLDNFREKIERITEALRLFKEMASNNMSIDDSLFKELNKLFNGKQIPKNINTDYVNEKLREIYNIKRTSNTSEEKAKNLFKVNDLQSVLDVLNKINQSLEELVESATAFSEKFKDGFNVTASVEEIDKLTNRVKELEDELSKIKLNPISVDKSNISSENTQQGKSQQTIINAMAKVREHTVIARREEEKRQELAQNKAINKALEQEYEEKQKNIQATKKQIELDREKALEFTKSASKRLSTAISKYSYGDTSDATAMMKQMNRGVSNFGDLSNVQGNIINLSSTVNKIIADLEISHEQALKELNEEIKAEENLQKQKDGFNKKNLNAIDLEIQKQEEASKRFSSTLKSQMEDREKQLKSLQSVIDGANKDYNNRNTKPNNENRSVEYQQTLDKYLASIEELKAEKNRLSQLPFILDEELSKFRDLEEIVQENAKAAEQKAKQVRKLAEEKRKFRQQEKQSTQSSVDKALKDQVSAWKQIQSIREKIAKTNNADEIAMLKESKKYYQEQYNNANKILKVNDGLYDKEAQIARLEQVRLEANAKLVEYKNKQAKSNAEQKAKALLEITKETEKQTQNQQKKWKEFQKEQADYVSNKQEIEAIERNKIAYQELLDTIQKYSEVSKRIAKNQTLDGDIELANKLEDKISELQKQPILSSSQIEKSERDLVNLYDKLETLEKQTQSKNAEQEAKAVKEEWDKNVKAIQDYMDAVTKLNNLNAKDKGTGKYSSQIALQEKNVEELKEKALEARTAITSMINPHDVPLNTWRDYLDVMEKFSQASLGSAESVAKLEDALRTMDFSSLESAGTKFDSQFKNLSIKPDGDHQFLSWTNDLKELNAKIDEYNSKVKYLKENNIVDGEQVDEVKNLRDEIEETINVMTKTPQAKRGWTDIGVSKAAEKVANVLKQNTKMSKEAREAIRAYYDELRSGNPSQPIDEILVKVNQLVQKERELGRVGKSFGEIFKEKVIYGGAAQLAGMVGFYDVINVFRQGFETIKEYDNALTEMNKVSKESIEILKEFQKESFDLADAVGTTASQIQNSTADFLRLGESFEQAKQSAQDANALFKVAEFDNISEATDALVAMSQAYKELDKSQINDVLNYTGNNFSISTSELASALQRSAATLKVAGNDIYEATALVTAGNAVLQDAETVGSGLKMISLRILGTEEAKNELASLGENVDDFVVQTKSKIDETVRNYTAVASNAFKGISVLDENGNYRSTYEILRDISLVYQEILEADKKAGTNRGQALLEVLAGKNRSNVAASILQSPELLTSVYEEAMKNSQGSVEKELEAQLQSIETHLNQLKNAWDELWINENNREVITFFLDLAKGILEVVDDVGVLNTAIMGIGAFAGIKNFGKTYECMVSNRNCFEYALHA